MNNKSLQRMKQAQDNQDCIEIYKAGMAEYKGYNKPVIKRFRYCNAETIETENYILLRSYSTIIAVYDKISNILVDVLYYAYGYTSTSNQHIHKFYKDLSFTNFELEFLRFRW